MTCEYGNVPHECTEVADYIVWSDVNLQWLGACAAAVQKWRRSEGWRTVVVAAVD